MKAVLYIAFLLLVGCASNPPFSPVVGNEVFRTYVKQSLNGQRTGAEHTKFREAYQGNEEGLSYFFIEAYRRAMSSDVKPADEVFLTWLLTTLMLKNGDQVFADTLLKESNEVRSAVFSFLSSPFIPEEFTSTRKLKGEAPEIDFPLEQAYKRIS